MKVDELIHELRSRFMGDEVVSFSYRNVDLQYDCGVVNTVEAVDVQLAGEEKMTPGCLLGIQGEEEDEEKWATPAG